jgi:hypothetical protein
MCFKLRPYIIMNAKENSDPKTMAIMPSPANIPPPKREFTARKEPTIGSICPGT